MICPLSQARPYRKTRADAATRGLAVANDTADGQRREARAKQLEAAVTAPLDGGR
jgi:hypothetical protein